MKKILILMLVLCCQIAAGQQIWQAQHHSKRIILKGKLPFSIQDSILISMPEQGLNGIPVFRSETAASQKWENKSYGLGLEITSQTKDSLSGIFENYQATFPLNFTRVDSIKPITFPQHPKPPFPYRSEQVLFKGKETEITYGGTLNIPKHQEKYPLAILITGTGQQDREYTYSGHQFFNVLADYLARNGIASLRMGDRGMGKTSGNFSEATTADFAADVKEALHFLQQEKNIDTSFLGLIGHSEGAMVANIVAATAKDIQFMVSLSGVGIKGMDILKLQNRRLLESSEMPENLVDKNMELYSMLFETVYNSAENMEEDLQKAMKNWVSRQDSISLQQMGLTEGRDQNFIYRYQRMAATPWYRFMIKYNPADYRTNIRFPVLAVNGDKDNMVPAEENIAGFKKNINPELLSTKIFPGLNHMFQHCKDCTQQEIPRLEEVFAPEVLDFVSEWINNTYQDTK